MHYFIWLNVLCIFGVYIDEELARVSHTKMTSDFEII